MDVTFKKDDMIAALLRLKNAYDVKRPALMCFQVVIEPKKDYMTMYSADGWALIKVQVPLIENNFDKRKEYVIPQGFIDGATGYLNQDIGSENAFLRQLFNPTEGSIEFEGLKGYWGRLLLLGTENRLGNYHLYYIDIKFPDCEHVLALHTFDLVAHGVRSRAKVFDDVRKYKFLTDENESCRYWHWDIKKHERVKGDQLGSYYFDPHLVINAVNDAYGSHFSYEMYLDKDTVWNKDDTVDYMYTMNIIYHDRSDFITSILVMGRLPKGASYNE